MPSRRGGPERLRADPDDLTADVTRRARGNSKTGEAGPSAIDHFRSFGIMQR